MKTSKAKKKRAKKKKPTREYCCAQCGGDLELEEHYSGRVASSIDPETGFMRPKELLGEVSDYPDFEVHCVRSDGCQTGWTIDTETYNLKFVGNAADRIVRGSEDRV